MFCLEKSPMAFPQRIPVRNSSAANILAASLSLRFSQHQSQLLSGHKSILIPSAVCEGISCLLLLFFFPLVFTNHSKVQPNILLGKREIKRTECFCFFWSQSLARHSTLAASLNSCVPLGELLNDSVSPCLTCGRRKGSFPHSVIVSINVNV